MTVVIIGAVAAGTKVAAKLKRELGEDCRVILLEKQDYISYSGCSLPYFVEGIIPDYQSLFINTPQDFIDITGVDLRCDAQATEIDRKNKLVTVRYLKTGGSEKIAYDKLVLAVGAVPIRPPVEGSDLPGTFVLRTPENAATLKDAVRAGMKRAVVLGGGAIGLEIAQSLKEQGVRPVVLDMAEQILPGFDKDFAEYVGSCLMENGIPVFTGEKLTAIRGDGKVEMVFTETRKMKADAVIMAAGIRPNTAFLQNSGLKMAKNGALLVDDTMATNDPDVYAVGDCAVHKNRLTGEYSWEPLGSVAAVTGRVCARVLAGEKAAYPGVLGTTLLKTCGTNVAKTGLSQAEAEHAGWEAVSSTIAVDDKVPYYPGASVFIIRIVAEKKTHRLLGIQAAGKGAVDKIVDIGVTAISHAATLESLQCMDLSYAPPFSTALHPLMQAVNVLLNKENGRMEGVGISGFRRLPEDTLYLDVMKTAHIQQYQSMPVKTIHRELEGVSKNRPIALVCEKGKQAYLAQNKLRQYGYTNTVVLEGGVIFNNIEE